MMWLLNEAWWAVPLSTRSRIRIFQEERPFLGKEDFKALVHRVLWLVGFALREIRIDGRVEHQAVVENKFGIEADFALNVPVVQTRLNGVAVIHTVQAAEVPVRIELREG
jgi:hypothetical protein